MALLRRLVTAVFVLALIAGVQTRVFPMMQIAKAEAGMAGMMHGALGGDCKGCPDGKASMKSDCLAACATALALPPPLNVAPNSVHTVAWSWTNDSADARSPAPELSPPRR